MTRRFIVRPLAEADLEDAARWYGEERAGLADRFLGDVNRTFPREEDPELYEQIRLAWKGLAERSPENSVYREQAARFATQDEPSYAEALYREGASLEPAAAKWPEHLGNLLMRRSKSAADAVTAIELAREAVKAFERAHELESWDFRRHGLQISIARAAVAAGLTEVATVAAEAVLRDASQFECTWQCGNAGLPLTFGSAVQSCYSE